jgi:hypothetical protein
MSADRLTKDEQRDALERLYASLKRVHARAPDLTLTGLLGLLYIALETMDGDIGRMPQTGKIARELEMSPSGTSRLLATLSKGRGTRGNVSEGLDLVITNDWIPGRRPDGFVLTARGRERVIELMTDLTGRAPQAFSPLDEGAFLLAMMRKP